MGIGGQLNQTSPPTTNYRGGRNLDRSVPPEMRPGFTETRQIAGSDWSGERLPAGIAGWLLPLVSAGESD